MLDEHFVRLRLDDENLAGELIGARVRRAAATGNGNHQSGNQQSQLIINLQSEI